MKIEITKGFGPYKEGSLIDLEETRSGAPRNIYWRRRLKDGDCCRVYEETAPSKPTIVTKNSKPKSEAKVKSKPAKKAKTKTEGED